MLYTAGNWATVGRVGRHEFALYRRTWICQSECAHWHANLGTRVKLVLNNFASTSNHKPQQQTSICCTVILHILQLAAEFHPHRPTSCFKTFPELQLS